MRGRFKRQLHIKLCAIRTRAEVDFSVMPFDDDSVADYQAESRAGAALGCEEGQRKDVGLGLWRNSTAIVRDFNKKKLAVAARADIDATRPADGVNCIIDEVRPVESCEPTSVVCHLISLCARTTALVKFVQCDFRSELNLNSGRSLQMPDRSADTGNLQQGLKPHFNK